ncbi:hypothetical protein ILUMI_20445 [Ignelater luminosus]|uniref:Uncharacterized protein n=1 Tax=Ignelater luminosus TaxID=2038154 RepID=A0A8K0CHF8_IGNLU|nr:hypothetical protein ILUMI_20445 [Ignelater luminosus]
MLAIIGGGDTNKTSYFISDISDYSDSNDKAEERVLAYETASEDEKEKNCFDDVIVKETDSDVSEAPEANKSEQLPIEPGSTVFGINPLTTVKRYSKTDNKKVEIQCPSASREYNKHMGRVDKAIIDLQANLNDGTVYKFDCQTRNKKSMLLKNFRSDLANACVGKPK